MGLMGLIRADYGGLLGTLSGLTARTTQLPSNRPEIPPYRDHKTLNRGTLGGLGKSTDHPSKGP